MAFDLPGSEGTPVTDVASIALLFSSAFLSATLLPGSSEALLIALLASGNGDPAMLALVATIGNTLGAVTNWGLGRFFERFKGSRWYPISATAHARAQSWFARFGVWSLLFSWFPVIGDPLTVVAGMMRIGFWRFVILVATGKLLRYGFVVLVWQHWPSGLPA
jgi:membrane protein YqaA with SNARE-associated domain